METNQIIAGDNINRFYPEVSWSNFENLLAICRKGCNFQIAKYDGIANMVSYTNVKAIAITSSFTPDDKYVAIGCEGQVEIHEVIKNDNNFLVQLLQTISFPLFINTIQIENSIEFDHLNCMIITTNNNVSTWARNGWQLVQSIDFKYNGNKS